jgi:hypothetical protein
MVLVLIEYTVWVMIGLWSLILIDNLYAKAAGGLLLALALLRAILEPRRETNERQPSPPPTQSERAAGRDPADADREGADQAAPAPGSRRVF